MKYICIFFILLISGLVNAQNSLLVGKWKLVEMQKDSIIVFNRDSIDISIAVRFKNSLKTKDTLLHSDSVAIIEYVNNVHSLMKQTYYEFSENEGLTAGVLDSRNGEFYLASRTGGYMLDGHKIGLHLGSIQTYIYEVDDSTLFLRPFADGVIDEKGYLLLKRVK